MQKNNLYEIYKTGCFSDMRGEKVAVFYDLWLACNFVDYEATFGNSFVIICDGEEVYPND